MKLKHLLNEFYKQNAIHHFMIGEYYAKPQFDSVMIIDDNEMDIYIAEKIIAEFSDTKSVLNFRCVKAALEHIKTNGTPQVILLEVIINDLTGVEFLRGLKKLKVDIEASKIILMSSALDYQLNLLTEILKFKGVSKVVHKPISSEIFKEVYALINVKEYK